MDGRSRLSGSLTLYPSVREGLALQRILLLLKMVRCGICGQSYARSWSFRLHNPHMESVHPEFWNWLRKWAITLLAIPGVGAWILVFADLQAIKTGSILALVLPNTLYVIIVYSWMVRWMLKVRQVKRRWKQEHGPYG